MVVDPRERGAVVGRNPGRGGENCGPGNRTAAAQFAEYATEYPDGDGSGAPGGTAVRNGAVCVGIARYAEPPRLPLMVRSVHLKESLATLLIASYAACVVFLPSPLWAIALAAVP